MAKRRKKQPKKRREPREVEETGPTPETVAHAKEAPPEPIPVMVEQGWLDTAGERAALEIREVYKAITAAGRVKGNKLSPNPHGVLDINDNLDRAHAERYLPWCRETGPVLVGIVLETVVESKMPGIFMQGVANALQDYAKRFR